MKRNKKILLAALGTTVAGLFGLSACQYLPPLEGRTASAHLPSDTDSRLARALSPALAAHPQLSGMHTLSGGRDAFVARAALAEAADHTLDVQYYIWHDDISGKILFHALHKAAERGVRVRLLLDDNNTNGMDAVLQGLNRHPNIEVRLFNPFVNRSFRALGYLTDFPRLNRRMHNKSFTADNQVSVIGGRNIGDEYFEVGEGTQFVDLDVIVAGKVVDEISQDFDRYWNSASAYPLEKIVPQKVAETPPDLTRQEEESAKGRAYVEALRASELSQQLQTGSIGFDWVKMNLVSDDPAKALSRGNPKESVVARLDESIGEPQSELFLVSPYFVPTPSGVEALTRLSAQGVKVSVLTNSLDATDVAVVHSGYIKYREALLDGGVQVFELKKTASGKVGRDRGLTGSSASSLHAKTFSVDGERVFIGSFNFDPRSARLNTEMGVVAEHPALAEKMTSELTAQMPEIAYTVSRDTDGKLIWQTEENGDTQTLTGEPETGVFKRAWVKFLSWLPLDWML